MTEAAQRMAVVTEALSWLGTPYHHMGRVKGRHGGVDCAMLIAEVYERAGIIPHLDVAFYPHDWHLHRRDERFLGYILPHAHPIEAPLVGDLVTFRFGLGFAHAAIVVFPGWPRIIHSDMDARCVTLADGTAGRHAHERSGAERERKFFSIWGGPS